MGKRLTFAEKVRKMYFVATDRHDQDGNEKADPTRVEIPAGFRPQPTLHEMIQQHLRSNAIMERQRARGEETFEDSMDFGPDEEDPLPATVHEVRDMQEEELTQAVQHATRNSAVRGAAKRLQKDASVGRVRSEEGRDDLPGKQSGGGAPAVRSVESSKGSGEEGPKAS